MTQHNQAAEMDCHRLAELALKALDALSERLIAKGDFELGKLASFASGVVMGLEIYTR